MSFGTPPIVHNIFLQQSSRWLPLAGPSSPAPLLDIHWLNFESELPRTARRLGLSLLTLVRYFVNTYGVYFTCTKDSGNGSSVLLLCTHMLYLMNWPGVEGELSTKFIQIDAHALIDANSVIIKLLAYKNRWNWWSLYQKCIPYVYDELSRYLQLFCSPAMILTSDFEPIIMFQFQVLLTLSALLLEWIQYHLNSHIRRHNTGSPVKLDW